MANVLSTEAVMTLESQHPFGKAWGNRPRANVLKVRNKVQHTGPVFSWLWIEREETVSRYEDGAVRSAACHVHYEMLISTRFGQAEKGTFSGGWLPWSTGPDIVSLTSPNCGKGHVKLELPDELKGLRIGTYLMNEVVGWVKQWPDAMVNPVQLLAAQAYGDNKKRRNRFYEQFKLVFDYENEETREAGVSRPMPASELAQVDATQFEDWKEDIEEIDAREFTRKLLRENDSLHAELRRAHRDYEHLSKLMAFARKRPISFAMAQLWDNGIT